MADIGKWLLIGGGAVAGVAAIPMLVGFGSAGIVGGSIAAAIQSSIGNVAAGSAFAVAQNLGAQGVFLTAGYAGGATAAAGAALAVAGKKNEDDDEEKEMKEEEQGDKEEEQGDKEEE